MAGFMISVKKIKKSFNENIVLDGISLDVSKGESMVVIGGSGTGGYSLSKTC